MLDNCRIPSFRDLGTRLSNLQFLWMSNCHVTDLSGMNGLPLLEELYLSFNDIVYLDELTFHENIQVIDLEANKIEDISQVDNLGTCPMLNCVTLSGNPIEKKEGVNYRRKVAACISNLITLDDLEISGADQQEIEIITSISESTPPKKPNTHAWSSPDAADTTTTTTSTNVDPDR